MHIIIDGYNIIRQSETFSRLDLQDLQLGREALIDALSEYRKVKRHRVTVVFDGTRATGAPRRRDRVKGIDIQFSRLGETADTVIKQMAAREREKSLVVSSDRDVADFCASRGAVSVSSQEFEYRMALAGFMPGVDEAESVSAGWVPTTKKKGPSRRLSKKNRQRKKKINKL